MKNMNILMLISLNIKEWRSLKNIIINFCPDFNEITGRNGVGKSSILDIIRFILFFKDENDKFSNNYKTINLNGLISYPNVELIIKYNEKKIVLKYENNDWYIDNIKFANKDAYKMQLSKIVEIKDFDYLYDNINPNNLYNTFTTGTAESKDGRNRITKIVNTMLPLNEKIDSEELNNLILEISDFENKKSMKEKKIKENEIELKNFKENNKEITNWNINGTPLDDEEFKELKKKEEQIRNHQMEKEITEHDIRKLSSEKFEIENKINDDKFLNSKKKISIGKLILLTIITLGLYLIYFFKNKSNSDVYETSTYLNKKLKEVESKISELYKKLNILKKSPLENEDIHEIKSKINYFDIEKTNEGLFNMRKIKHNEMNKNNSEAKKELENIQNKLQLDKSELYKIQQKINEVLKKSFDNFDIDLFDKKGNEKFEITQNGISLKFLNNSNKYNIIYQLNEFLKKDGIKTFVLIDHGESFNEFDIKNSTQIICTKVDKENLKLNGKNVN